VNQLHQMNVDLAGGTVTEKAYQTWSLKMKPEGRPEPARTEALKKSQELHLRTRCKIGHNFLKKANPLRREEMDEVMRETGGGNRERRGGATEYLGNL